MNKPKIKQKYTLALLFTLVLPVSIFSQKDTVDVYSYNLIELSEFTINSASKTPQEISDVPANIRIITAREISENGYFTLDQALADLPGFQFRNIQGFNSYVFQRGFPSQNNLILVLIDGVQINELNSGGFYSGGQYNLDNIERIEVIYGPSSVVYGTNAISGIINIVTKENQGLSVNALTGNFNTFGSNVNYGIKKSDFALSISGMYKTTEKTNLGGKEGGNFWSEQMENFEDDYSFDAKIKYKDFVLGANYQNKQASRTTNYSSNSTIYQDFGTKWNIQFANLYLGFTHKFSEKLFFSSNLYNRNATVKDNTIAYITDTSQIGYYRPNNLVGLENILSYKIKKIKTILGLVTEYEDLAESFSKTYSSSSSEIPLPPIKPNMLKNYLLSSFLEADYHPFSYFSIFGGIRFDYSSFYDKVLTPRAGLIFKNKFLNSKLIYAEAFRAPRPWDYTAGLGNPELTPEYMTSTEFSNKFYFSNKFFVSLSVYKNTLKNAFSKEVIEQSNNYRWINQGQIETNGSEIYFKYSTKKLSFYGNYTYNYSFDESKIQIPEIAKHSANAGFTYRFKYFFRVSLKANYYGKRQNPKLIMATNSYTIKPTTIFNASFMYTKFKKVNFQIIANNIFNTEYYHTSNRPPDRYRQAQRNFMLKLTYNFATND